MDDRDRIRAEKARKLRYRKAVAVEMNIDLIREELTNIGEECAEVQWFVDSEDGYDTLLNALDGDDEEAHEFKMAFSTLSANVESMQEDIYQYDYDYNYRVPDVFDDFFVAIRASVSGHGGFMGYDEYETDYYGLNYYEEDEAIKESQKRIKRLTKDQMIEAAHKCFNIAVQFIGLRSRYDDLKAAMDILRGQNAGFLKHVRAIEEAYEAATRSEYPWKCDSKEFDKMLERLPERCWIE